MPELFCSGEPSTQYLSVLFFVCNLLVFTGCYVSLWTGLSCIGKVEMCSLIKQLFECLTCSVSPLPSAFLSSLWFKWRPAEPAKFTSKDHTITMWMYWFKRELWVEWMEDWMDMRFLMRRTLVVVLFQEFDDPSWLRTPPNDTWKRGVRRNGWVNMERDRLG